MSPSPLTGRNVLVTGGSGSFGHAFIRRALDDGARRVVVFSRDELKQAQMRTLFGDDARLRFFVGDVRDRIRLRLAMQGVEDVVHAAAMKRIEVCEQDPSEAVATNVIGTENVAHVAIDCGVERAVFLSTDKAPAAHTLYGGTKFVAERLWVQSNVFAAGSPTKLSATRYGNVLGSRGSVLDLWRQQFRMRDPLTITDARATRFWMTIGQAVDLVTLALGRMVGGEIFVPKVPSAPILDLARAVVEGNGTYAPGHIETGLRPGERLHETLISSDEARDTADMRTHYLIEPTERTWRTDKGWKPALAVPAGFSYRSDNNPEQYTVEQLRDLIQGRRAA